MPGTVSDAQKVCGEYLVNGWMHEWMFPWRKLYSWSGWRDCPCSRFRFKWASPKCPSMHPDWPHLSATCIHSVFKTVHGLMLFLSFMSKRRHGQDFSVYFLLLILIIPLTDDLDGYSSGKMMKKITAYFSTHWNVLSSLSHMKTSHIMNHCLAFHGRLPTPRLLSALPLSLPSTLERWYIVKSF